jgi:heat shock protein HtpX
MSLAKLRFSMLTTLAIIIGVSTLFFAFVLTMVEAFDILTLVVFVAGFNILQWLMAPFLIDLMYQTKKVSPQEQPELYQIVQRVSQRANLPVPRIMVANLPIPNAFAYGSPVAGTRVAVTSGLLRTLESEEVEAVLGHELGHIKHRDVQIMMFVSVLPAILYYVGYSLSMQSSYSRDRNRSSGFALIGVLSMVSYFVLSLLSLQLSRQREYYADRHAVQVVDDGARKLQEALAKIVTYTGRVRATNRVRVTNQPYGLSSFKSLYISDPDTAERDYEEIRSNSSGTQDSELVNNILSSRTSGFDSLAEIFSTHPNIVKRIKALEQLRQ